MFWQRRWKESSSIVTVCFLYREVAGRPARPHKPAEEINEAVESDVYKSCASFLDAVAAKNRSCRRPVTDHGGGSCGTAFDLGGIFAEESDLDEKENEWFAAGEKNRSENSSLRPWRSVVRTGSWDKVDFFIVL